MLFNRPDNTKKLPLPSPCRIWNPSTTWFLGFTRVNKPNGISISTTVFAGLTNATNTHRPCCSNRLRLDIAAMRPNNNNNDKMTSQHCQKLLHHVLHHTTEKHNDITAIHCHYWERRETTTTTTTAPDMTVGGCGVVTVTLTKLFGRTPSDVVVLLLPRSHISPPTHPGQATSCGTCLNSIRQSRHYYTTTTNVKI